MLFAPIVPAHHLPMIEPYPYHMSLAHLVQESLSYATFYNRMAKKNFVILDNGAAEGGQMDIDRWLTAISIIKPTEVVLYDSIGKYEETKEGTQDSYGALVNSGMQVPSIMGVPHGEDLNKVLTCARWMLDQDYINTIGISKFLTRQFDRYDVRFEIIETLADHAQDAGKDIHVLGCEKSLAELIDIRMYFNHVVRGCDTALPTLFAKSEMEITASHSRPACEIEFLGDKGIHTGLLAGNVAAMFGILE